MAETHAGELIAVQCKHYGQETTVSKQDVDSFLSESNRDQFAERVLVATTDRMSAGARQVIAGQEKPVALVLRDRLKTATVDWSRFLDQSMPVLETKKPRPHQERALRDLINGFDTASRGQLIMPCGTGKTLTSLWLADRLDCSRVLVVAPTLALLRQLVQVWAAEIDGDTAFLKVCSDKRDPACELDAADLESAELGPGVTTDPDQIAEFLAAEGRRVIFSTYDSTPRIAEAMSSLSDPAPFDLVVCDEAHHCAGVTTANQKTILHEKRIPARRRLFVTATPTVFGVGAIQLARNAHTKIASMDDREVFGRVMHSLSFKRAIEEGLLCSYRVVVMPVSDQEVAELVKRRELVTTDGERVTDAYTLAAEIAALRLIERFDCRRLVAFHPSVDGSRRFTADVGGANALLPIDERVSFHAAHVDGYMTKTKRNQVLDRFSNEDETPHLLSNVKLLAEGVDVPGIDAIVFMDTHRNTAAIVQAIGRALRPAPNKSAGSILIPLLVQEGQSVEEALRYSEHGSVLEVLAALRSLDSDIRATIDSVRIELGPRAPRSKGDSQWIVDVPTEVGADFADAVEVAVVDVLNARRSNPAALEAIVSTDSSKLLSPANVSWDDPQICEIGLEYAKECRYSSYSEPWLRDFYAGFNLKKWREVLYRHWEADSLPAEMKRDCARVLNWLSIPRGKHRKVRREMAQLDPRDLADTLEDWLNTWGADHYDWEIDEAVRDHRLGYGSHLSTASVLAVIPERWPRKQRVRLALEMLKIGAETAAQADPNQLSAMSGFCGALGKPGRSHDLDAKPTAENASRSEFNAVAFGWEAGQRALALVEKARLKHARNKQSSRTTRKRKRRVSTSKQRAA